MAEGKLSGLIMLFIIVVIGAVLTIEIADSLDPVTSSWQAVNESYDISPHKGLSSGNINGTVQGELTYDDLASVDTFYLSNDTLLVENTDYSVGLSGGHIYLINTTKTATYNNSNLSSITYTYYPDDYVEGGASRAILNLLVLFFALGILGIVIYYFYKNYLKDLM
jgi:hypothetical protein